MLKYRIPVYFAMEQIPLKIVVKQERDWITLTAFNTKNNILPLLQKENVVLSTEASELLSEKPRGDTSRGEAEETMADLLSEQQGSDFAEAKAEIPEPTKSVPDVYSNYPPGWRSTKCCD
jgi:hypothetical protein